MRDTRAQMHVTTLGICPQWRSSTEQELAGDESSRQVVEVQHAQVLPSSSRQQTPQSGVQLATARPGSALPITHRHISFETGRRDRVQQLRPPPSGHFSRAQFRELAIDRRGRLFLSFSDFDWTLDENEGDPDEAYWRGTVAVSHDAGDTWKLADTTTDSSDLASEPCDHPWVSPATRFLQRLMVSTAALFWAPIVHAAPGWADLDLPGGGRATRYLPMGVSPDDAAPLVIFLHGAGGMPEHYHDHLEGHADALDVVLLLPESAGQGWGGADTTTIVQGLDAVEDELMIDDRRIYLAGHSAGGAFAYLLAYEGAEGFAAVFSMSAPFYSVSSISDPMHTAPIRMYYGADDPNYTGGAAAMLEGQWTQLGISHETDVQPGYGHSTWPSSSILAGFEFLLSVEYPGGEPDPDPDPEPDPEPEPEPDTETMRAETESGDEAADADSTSSGGDSRGSGEEGEGTGGPSLPGEDDDRESTQSCACTSSPSGPRGALSLGLALLVIAGTRRR